MSEDVKIALAQARVDDAKARLIRTVQLLTAQVQPDKIVRDMWESAKVKGADLAEDAVDAVRRRPVAAGGVLAALTLFLAREPIKDAAVKTYDVLTSPAKKKPAKTNGTTPGETKPPAPTAKRRSRKTTRELKKTESVK